MSVRGSIVFLAAFSLALSACQKPGDGAPEASAPLVKKTPAVPTSAVAAASSVAPAKASSSEEKPAIPSLVIDTFDGKKFNLADHRGHWVIVNFWATWCNPCLKEMPDLDAFDQSRKDVDVIGLSYEEIEHADMVAFLKQHVVHYPIAVLDTFNPPADFETPRGLPMTYLIAPDGKVAKKFLGPVTASELGMFIRDAAKLQPKPSA
jgi:thiol-disulfide isomerase/thioredoxin